MKCPTCGRAMAWSAEFPERPFCSERCRLIDLGAWLSGDRVIPGEPVDPQPLPDGAPQGNAAPGGVADRER